MEKLVHNVATGEVTLVDFSAEELAQLEKDKAEAKAEKLLKEEKAAEKLAILERLGLTDEEAKVLLG